MFNIGIIQKHLLKPIIPLIRVNGIINEKLTAIVKKQLKLVNTNTSKALAVLVNSPGGSGVQSDIICQLLTNFAHHNKLPLYTFAQDIAASGGYMILSIGQKVYVDENSLVGSIGAVGSMLSIKQFLENYKIEPRMFTSSPNLGEHLLSPLHESSEERAKYLMKIIAPVCELFVNHVEQQRKDKFKISKDERQKVIYNSDVFLGKKSVDLGLADAVGSYMNVLNKDFPTAVPKFIETRRFIDHFLCSGVKFKLNISFDNKSIENQNVQHLKNNLASNFFKDEV